MSYLVQNWAETAPVADVYERAIVTLMARRADDDGTGCWPSVRSMAAYALCDEKTIERRLAAMRKRKLIAFGDQKLVKHAAPQYRPKVYDLLVPYRWYSEDQLQEVNQRRAQAGKPPLRAADRPPIVSPPQRGRKTRTDKGVERPPAPPFEEQLPSSEPQSEAQGGLTVPPGEGGPDETPETPEGTNSPLQRGLTVPPRGVYKTPKAVLGKPSIESVPGGLTAAPQTPAAQINNSSDLLVTDQLNPVGNPPHACAEQKPGTRDTHAGDENRQVSGDARRPMGFESWGVGALLNELGVQAMRLNDTTGQEAFAASRRQAALRQECRRRGMRPETIEQAEFGTPDGDIDGHGQELALVGPKVVTTRTGKTRTARRRSRR